MTFLKMIAISLCLGSMAYAQNVVPLQPGQSIDSRSLNYGDVVTCGYQGSNPGFPGGPQQPPGPPPPPPPVCQISSVQNAVSSARSSISLLRNGKCGYRVDRCKDNLEDHAVQSSKNALYNDLQRIGRDLESQCRQRACSQFDLSSAQRSLDELISEARNSQMTYKEDSSEVRHQANMLDSDAGLRVRCF